MDKIIRISCALFLIISSFIIGFLYAGVSGAIIFGVLITLAWVVLKQRIWRKIILKIIISILLISCLGYYLMIACGLLGANEVVHEKVLNIQDELLKEGYTPRWFIISQKRSQFFNSFLKNSVKNGKSKHHDGKAIDLFIIDIDGDGRYNIDDFELMKAAMIKCEKSNPGTKGNIYNYFGRGSISQHMVHIEIK